MTSLFPIRIPVLTGNNHELRSKSIEYREDLFAGCKCRLHACTSSPIKRTSRMRYTSGGYSIFKTNTQYKVFVKCKPQTTLWPECAQDVIKVAQNMCDLLKNEDRNEMCRIWINNFPHFIMKITE